MHKLTKWILVGLGLGIIVGLAMNIWAPALFEQVDSYFFAPVGDVFLRLIMMLVVPLVFFSITTGIADLGDPKKLGRMGGKTIAFFMATSVISLTIALTLALIINPGSPGMLSDEVTEDYEADEAPPVIETLVNIVPENPVEAMAMGEMLQIITFAILIGITISLIGEKVSGVKSLFEQGNMIMMKLVTFVMYVAPFGAFALIASALGDAGAEAITSLLAYMMTIILGLLIQCIVVYSILVYTLGKMNPLTFYKGFWPAMTVAFSLSSSSGALPVSMKSAQENLKVSKGVSGFVQPLGATINMDGTGIMQAVATVFIAQVYGEDLGLTSLLIIVLTATLASIGTASVPGVGMIMLAMVLTSVGLPTEGIALVLGVDRLLDMMRTAVNITGDAVLAVIVEHGEQKREANGKSD